MPLMIINCRDRTYRRSDSEQNHRPHFDEVGYEEPLLMPSTQRIVDNVADDDTDDDVLELPSTLVSNSAKDREQEQVMDDDDFDDDVLELPSTMRN